MARDSTELVPSAGGYISYGYHWTNYVRSHATAGFTKIKNEDFESDDAFDSTQYVLVNTFWQVTKGVRTGVEHSRGRRENKDGQDGTANRISFIVYYDF
ncbi:MAG: hypothetical protein JSW50_15255 [Candidatus Latescibacterota bacterium]|nr:MAG: hypothetical protein JSW50_15255 [Candidatus Latescibacterota bacterium]